MISEPIDAVYTWVNGDDDAFQQRLSKYRCKTREEDENATGPKRFRDNGELRYSLRSLYRHLPWIRHIYLVTNGQIPTWLDTNHPGLTLVQHESIYPNASHLPTFNSTSIECHLHRIPGLAKRFLYFNDDSFLGDTVRKDDFYSSSSGFRIRLEHWGISDRSEDWPVHDRIYHNTQKLLKRKFEISHAFLNPIHAPCLIDRDLMTAVLDLYPEEVDRTSSHRFRCVDGIAPIYLYVHYLISKPLPHRIWVHQSQQKWSSLFRRFAARCSLLPRAKVEYLLLQDAAPSHLSILSEIQPKFLAIQDNGNVEMPNLQKVLNRIFPEPSPYERID